MTRRIAAGLVVLGLLLAVVAWANAGWWAAVLMSPSMEPFASPGDLLVHDQVPAEEIEAGDVITVAAAGDRLATHRVMRLALTQDGMIQARLKGDASPLPDPVPVLLQGDVARVVVVLPRIGSLVTTGAPLLWSGLVLLLLGSGVLVAGRRARSGAPRATGAGTGPTSSLADPRLAALLAACEEFAADGMPAVVLRDLARVRAAALLGLPPAERAGAVLALDDGARFYVLALADDDLEALAMIPPDSERRRQASAALDQWWLVVGRDVPSAVAEQLAPWPRP